MSPGAEATGGTAMRRRATTPGLARQGRQGRQAREYLIDLRGGRWVTLSGSGGSGGGGIATFWARWWDELARVVLLDAEEVLLCVAPDLDNVFGLDAGLNLPPVPAMGSERVEKQPVLVRRPRLASLRDDVCLARPLGGYSCCCCCHCLRVRVRVSLRVGVGSDAVVLGEVVAVGLRDRAGRGWEQRVHVLHKQCLRCREAAKDVKRGRTTIRVAATRPLFLRAASREISSRRFSSAARSTTKYPNVRQDYAIDYKCLRRLCNTCPHVF
jgi:hypothetical protein